MYSSSSRLIFWSICPSLEIPDSFFNFSSFTRTGSSLNSIIYPLNSLLMAPSAWCVLLMGTYLSVTSKLLSLITLLLISFLLNFSLITSNKPKPTKTNNKTITIVKTSNLPLFIIKFSNRDLYIFF